MIHISKHDVVNIEGFDFKNDFSGVNFTDKPKIDLSKLKTISKYLQSKTNNNIIIINLFYFNLVLDNRTLSNCRELLEINIDGLPCLENLQFGVNSKNTNFTIYSNYANYSLQYLDLSGNLSYFNLNNFIKLTSLRLDGSILETFNFELFKNLCNQLESLEITFDKFDEKSFFKLLDGHRFSNLKQLYLTKCCCMKSLKNFFFDRFPMLKVLAMYDLDIEIIENDAFSSLEQLEHIHLNNNLINFIGKNVFSNLKNLKSLDLCSNQLTYFDQEFIGLGNSVEIFLDYNKLPSLSSNKN